MGTEYYDAGNSYLLQYRNHFHKTRQDVWGRGGSRMDSEGFLHREAA